MSALVQGLGVGVLVVTASLAGAAAHRRLRAARIVGRLAGPPRGAHRRRRPQHLVTPPAWVAARLADAAPGRDAAVLATAWATVTPCLVVGGAWAGGPGLSLCAALVAVAGPVIALAWRRGAAGRVLEAALPDALEAVARAMRSGAGSHHAITEASAATGGPLGAELASVTGQLAGGVGLEAALEDLERRRPLPGVRLAVAALLLGAEAGGAHARALDGVAASVRARLDVNREVRALSSQARLSALVIACAPLGFAGLAMGTDAGSATFLLRTPLGLACLALGLGLDLAGAWWMHRIAMVPA